MIKKNNKISFKTFLEFGANKKTILNLYKKLGLNSRQYFLNLKFIHRSKIKNTLNKTLVGKNLKKRLHQLKIFSRQLQSSSILK